MTGFPNLTSEDSSLAPIFLNEETIQRSWNAKHVGAIPGPS